MTTDRLSKLESKFGRMLEPYLGRGRLKGRNNEITETDFAIGQRHDGSFVLCCGVRLGWYDYCDISGQTELGQEIEAKGMVSTEMGSYSGGTYNSEYED